MASTDDVLTELGTAPKAPAPAPAAAPKNGGGTSTDDVLKELPPAPPQTTVGATNTNVFQQVGASPDVPTRSDPYVGGPPTAPQPSMPPPAQRILDAAGAGSQINVLTPQAQAWFDRYIPYGSIIRDWASTPVQIAGSAGGATSQAVNEVFGERGGRDINPLLQSAVIVAGVTPPGTVVNPLSYPPFSRPLPIPPDVDIGPVPRPSLAPGATSATEVPPATSGVAPTTGAAAPVASAAPGVPAATTIQTSADMKNLANQYYKIAANRGIDTSLAPQATNKMIDAAQAFQQTEGGKIVTGDSALSGLQARLEALRDKPLTLQTVQEMDEGMSDNISQALRAGRNKEAARLQDIQQSWRDTYANAGPDDVIGGNEGFAALQPARQAWSAAKKMEAVEGMQAKAAGTSNPTTSFRTQVNNFANSAKSRGWSDDEIAALQQAATRGTIGEALHYFGSRLLPHVAGAVGASVGGIPGFFAGEATAHFAGGMARTAGEAAQAARINQLYSTLAKGAPPPPVPNPLTTGP